MSIEYFCPLMLDGGNSKCSVLFMIMVVIKYV
jgi:hypothetical protein